MKIASIVIALLLGPMAVGAFACSCEEMDKKKLFEAADSVFLAEVTSTRLIKKAAAMQSPTGQKNTQSATLGPESEDVVEARFTVIEFFKKGTTSIDFVRDLSYGFGNCSIGLLSGMEYIFFVHKGSGGLKNYVGMCTGSSAVSVQAQGFPEILRQLREYGSSATQK